MTQIEKQEQGERIYRKTLDGLPQFNADSPTTLVVLEFQKALRRALIDEDFLTMIKVDGEWQSVN